MGRNNTAWGHFDKSLGEEIKRMLNQLLEMGIKDVTKIEATALIAEKNKKSKMSKQEVKDFFYRRRGLIWKITNMIYLQF